MALDIIARLQLQGQQFRAQNQALFGDMEKRAADAATRLKTSFDRSFSEVQKMAAQAIAAPRTSGGALDLNVGQYRQAATEAENYAQAMREVEQAARRAAAATGDTSQETRTYIQAASAAAREAEEQARGYTLQANSLDRLQAELGKTSSRTFVSASAHKSLSREARNNQLALRNLGFQVSDVGASFASGAPLVTIFGQQIGQVGGALSDMTGKMGAVGRFLTNPWVAAFTTAAVVVTTLVSKTKDSADAAEAHTAAAKDLTSSINDLNAAVTRQVQSTHASIQAQIDDANAKRLRSIETRKAAVAELQLAKAEAERANADATGGRSLNYGAMGVSQSADSRVAAIEKQIAAQEKLIETSNQSVRLLRGQQIVQGVREKFDEAAAATGKYERALDNLNRKLAANQISEGQYRREVEKITVSRDAAMEASRKAGKADTEAKREGARAAREAAKAERELEASLVSIQQRFDPVASAAQKYAETLKEIVDLSSSGRISIGEKLVYEYRAAQEEAKRLKEQQKRDAEEVYARYGIRPANDLSDLLYGHGSNQAQRDRAREDQQKADDERRQRLERDYNELARFWSDAMRGGSDGFFRAFRRQGEDVVAEMAANLTMQLIGAVQQASPEMAAGLKGAYVGYQTAGPIGAVLGGIDAAIGKKLPDAVGKSVSGALKGAQTGTVVAGLGKSLGLGMSTTGSQVGGAIGSALPIPGGSIIGSVLGGLVGGLFKKPKYGTASIVTGDDGSLTGSLLAGRGAGQKAAAVGAASSVGAGIGSIADALGASITGIPNITIGTYKDKYRVSTTGYTGKLDYKGASASGLYNFDDDQQAAVEFAIKEALSRSVISGISQASINILKSGQDLDKAIEKAVTIESIPKMLKQRLDPLGYALDELNDRWEKNIAILKEGGATAAQMAEAQQLYNLELTEVKANTASASASLKDFLKSLTIGGDSPLSLRDQSDAAMAELAPWLDKINAGAAIDQDAYREAAESWLAVQRELFGSTAQYFDAFDRIQAATSKAIERVDNAQPIRTESDPFIQKTATATQASANLLEQMTEQTADVQQLLKGILAALQNGSLITANGRLYTGSKAA